MDDAGLFEHVAGARLVLLGAASHGTSEFHRERADISRRLICEAGFDAVAIEADWPGADRVDRYVRGLGDDRSAEAALGAVRNLPAWVWRNSEVAAFVAWLRSHNESLPAGAPAVRVYGIDLHGPDDAIAEGAELRDRARYEDVDEDGRFAAERSARLVEATVEHRLALIRSGADAWNVRERYMAETLEAIVGHRVRGGGPARVAVWAHNAHVGDAAATSRSRAGDLSLGHLVRRRAGTETALVGLTTYAGTVTAAPGWDEPAEARELPPARVGSHEWRFHGRDLRRLVLEPSELSGSGSERAVGVVYSASADASYYFDARIGDQFDVVVHVDETHALEPLAGLGEVSRRWPSS